METPKNVNQLVYEYDCTCISVFKHEELMLNATKANKKRIDRLVRKHLPDLYKSLMLDLYNPYDYYKTKKHLILVHSAIEYFLSYK